MYASQTKRLCVRGATSDETARVHQQHHSTSNALIHSLPPSALKQSTSVLVGEEEVGSNMTLCLPTDLTDNKYNQSDSKMNRKPVATASDHTPPFNVHADAPCEIEPSEDRTGNDLISKLAGETLEEKKLELLLAIRNLITASNKKKDSVASNPNFIKVVTNLVDDGSGDNSTNSSITVKTQIALLLCSVAKSGEHSIKVLNESLVYDKIINLILIAHDKVLIEACLRCIRSLMSYPRVSRTWILYDARCLSTRKDSSPPDGRGLLQKIIAHAQSSGSYVVQECVADIFATTCSKNRDQTLLYRANAIPCVVQLLESPSTRVVIASLNWLTQMCLKNHLISLEVTKASCPSGALVLDRLINLMDKELCHELQFLSARCFVHIYRTQSKDLMRNDSRIVSHVLPTLIGMVHKDKSPHLRIKSAECIAYFIGRETKLQNIASICDHLIESLASMLDHENNMISIELRNSASPSQYRCQRIQERGVVSWPSFTPQNQSLPSLDPRSPQPSDQAPQPSIQNSVEVSQEMRRAAFLALAALASNLEPIRKKISEHTSLMQHLQKNLTENDTKTLKSVLTCLLSLSRSVHQLRTNFTEQRLYNSLKGLLTTSSTNDVLTLVLAILCNISLDFSAGKQNFLDAKTIEFLCNLTRRNDPILKLHGMWCLMNMAYRTDQGLKSLILRSLGLNHLLNMLESGSSEDLVVKAFGLLKNLLSQQSHIDAIMNLHGEQIMQSLINVLEKPGPVRLKEEGLSVLKNITDGNEAKAYMMSPRVLNYLARTLVDEAAPIEVRLAIISCVTNLAHKKYERSVERRAEMRKFGIEEKLKSLLDSDNSILTNEASIAYRRFLNESETRRAS